MYVYVEQGNDFLFSISYLNENLNQFYIEHSDIKTETIEGFIEAVRLKIPNLCPIL